jgi:hypothetical protein
MQSVPLAKIPWIRMPPRQVFVAEATLDGLSCSSGTTFGSTVQQQVWILLGLSQTRTAEGKGVALLGASRSLSSSRILL